MISASDAHKKILTSVKSLPSEKVGLIDALDCYLASPVVAPIDLPVFDNSAMDGFALRSEEAQTASELAPVTFRVIGTIGAGDVPLTLPPPPPLEGGGKGEGQAIRIMTGAPIPEGTDTVIPFEECKTEGDFCLILEPVKGGKHIRKRGEDVKRGEKVLEGGEQITSRKIALLAALGVTHVSVGQRPRVRIISTGDELVEPGQPLPPGKIYNSNVYALVAALREIGVDAEAVSQSLDSEKDLKEAFKHHLDTDVLITLGGVSAGDYDLVPKILTEMGARIVFHKLAIKPGKPFLYATYVGARSPRPDGALHDKVQGGETPPLHIFALPGNPVSSLMVFDRFVRPALLKMMGAKNLFRPRRMAVSKTELKGSEGKEDYLRGVVKYIEGHYIAESAGSQGSAQLLTLSKANAVLIIPESKGKIEAQENVEVELFSEIL